MSNPPLHRTIVYLIRNTKTKSEIRLIGELIMMTDILDDHDRIAKFYNTFAQAYKLEEIFIENVLAHIEEEKLENTT